MFKEGLCNIDNLIIHWLNMILAIKIMGMLKNVWKAFKTNIRQNYYDLYLKVDIIIHLCVSNFYKESENSFELDPI